jgi:hypothetical protein
MKRSKFLVATFAVMLATAAPEQGIDGSIFMQYDMEIAAGTTKTVALDYKSF